MKRRSFLTAGTAATALLGSRAFSAQQPLPAERGDYFLLREYQLNQEQRSATMGYLQTALVPAANRLGVSPVGVFEVAVGHTGNVYVLLPSPNLELLVNLDLHLEQDAAYNKAAQPWLRATSAQPAFLRIRSELMRAFPSRPGVVKPKTNGGKRVFELRTYESPSQAEHERKVRMFESGEYDIFVSAGFQPVFYGDMRIGERMPQLTYMLAFESFAERDRLWASFGNSAAWQKLSHEQRFAYDNIVNNIDNVLLTPAGYSQI